MPESAAAVMRGWQAASLRLSGVQERASARHRICIAEYGGSRLWYYPPQNDQRQQLEPLCFVYAMVNRPTILDLLSERSFLGRFIDAGHPVYLLEWGDPDHAGYNRGLTHFVCTRMRALLQAAERHSGRQALALLGICQGGVLSLLYSLLYPESVRALVLLVTPVDFQTPGCVLYQRVRLVDVALLDDAWCLDGDMLVQLFHSLQPMRNSVGKYLQFAEDCADGDVTSRVALFCAMEAWIADCPDQPARFFQEFIGRFYQENRLLNGTLQVAGRTLALNQLSMPVLNIYGLRDHIVPAASSDALAACLPEGQYAALPVETGHIGMFVSARSLQVVPEAIRCWLETLS